MREEVKEALKRNKHLNYEKVAVKMRIAAKIADAMNSQGISKNELANRMRKSPSEITRWLSGTHNFTVDSLQEISLALGVEITTEKQQSATYQIEESAYKMEMIDKSLNNKATFVLPKHKVRPQIFIYSYCF